MNTFSQKLPATADVPSSIALIGVGRAGVAALENMLASGFGKGHSMAVCSDASALARSTADVKISISRAEHDKLATGVDMQLDSLNAALSNALREICAGKECVFIFAGLGAVTGTFLSPCLADAVRATGPRAFVFATTPFDSEGRNRRLRAETGLQTLASRADALLCLPGQRTSKLLPAGVSVKESLMATAAPLGDAARGLIRLLTLPASLPIHEREVCSMLVGQSCLAFAVAEATGAERAREIAERLLAHPLLSGAGGTVRTAAALLSLSGSPEVTQEELHDLTRRIESAWERAETHVGVAFDEAAPAGTMRALLILSAASGAGTGAKEAPAPSAELQMEDRPPTGGGNSSGTASTDNALVSRPKAKPAKQTELDLQMVSRGIFTKTPPTIHKGADLDVPTYIRRGITLTQN